MHTHVPTSSSKAHQCCCAFPDLLAAGTTFCYLDPEALAAFNPALRRFRALLPTVALENHRFASPHARSKGKRVEKTLLTSHNAQNAILVCRTYLHAYRLAYLGPILDRVHFCLEGFSPVPTGIQKDY